MFKKWTKEILNFLFIEKCVKCGKNEEILCKKCIDSFNLPHDNPNENIFACFSYKDPLIKKILVNLKYYHKRNLGEKLGYILYERMLEEISEIKSISGNKIILIPVPMTNTRLRKRGYNQASLIARGVYKACNDNIFEYREDILIKTEDTTPQAKIQNRQKRLINLKKCFLCIKKEDIKGRTIILIDDITTTGATLNEAMDELKKSGAKKTFGFVIAH